MAPRVVYRIEHETVRDGRGYNAGPFRYRKEYGDFQPNALDVWDIPTPRSDGIEDEIPEHYYFAFPDLETMHAWASASDQIKLTLAGFVLRTYAVPPDAIRYGDNQVIFDRTLATPIMH